MVAMETVGLALAIPFSISEAFSKHGARVGFLQRPDEIRPAFARPRRPGPTRSLARLSAPRPARPPAADLPGFNEEPPRDPAEDPPLPRGNGSSCPEARVAFGSTVLLNRSLLGFSTGGRFGRSDDGMLFDRLAFEVVQEWNCHGHRLVILRRDAPDFLERRDALERLVDARPCARFSSLR